MSLETLEALLARARAAGADAADAVLLAKARLGVHRRLGRTEQVERSDTVALGLTVFVGRRSATLPAATPDPSGFAALAARAVAMARAAPEDPHGGLCDLARPPDAADWLDLEDDAPPDPAALTTRAALAEEAALAVAGVTGSDGAVAGWVRTERWLATSAGFAGSTARTRHTLSATALAGSGSDAQREQDAHASVHLAELDDPQALGRRAGERAVARLHPGQAPAGVLPVLYDPRVAGSLLEHLAAALDGAAVARGASFLGGRLGSRVMRAGLQVIDDPRRQRGLRSRPFDGEGVATVARALVDDGVLASWLLDGRSARQLGLASTGHAARGIGAPSPAATNLYLAPGEDPPSALMAGIAEGLYVTALPGEVDLQGGTYSRAAGGFMIRNGALAEPVAKVALTGSLAAMFAGLVAASDLRFRLGMDAPTVRVEGITVGG